MIFLNRVLNDFDSNLIKMCFPKIKCKITNKYYKEINISDKYPIYERGFYTNIRFIE